MEMMIEKNKGGRPRKPDGAKRTKYVCLPLTPEEESLLRAKAKELHTNLATYIRSLVFSH
jgi:hypothetical protein